MSDMDDETRAFLRALFDNREVVPPDVVPTRQATPDELRENLLRQNETAGAWITVTVPGEVIEDADGNPIGMTAAEDVPTCVDAVVTARQLQRAGLSPEDVPNLTVWDPGTPGRDRS